MKTAVIISALMAGLAVAQDINQVPKCASPCLEKYTTGGGIAGCKALDVKCICSNSAFLDGIACCLESACDDAGKKAAVEFAKGICSAAGVTVPDQVECKSQSSGGASTAAATDSATKSGAAAGAGVTGTPTASPKGETSQTGAATEGAAKSTSAPGAAAGLDTAGGLFGAVAALLLAL